MQITTPKEAQSAIEESFEQIIKECKEVLGSELHYQAIIYHCLRTYGKIPTDQIGMNVKIRIPEPQTLHFKEKVLIKNIAFQKYGYEFIPDISIFSTSLEGDFRRRNHDNTLKHTLYSIEVKVSERRNSRLRAMEIKRDIDKLNAQNEETNILYDHEIGKGIFVVDTAPIEKERMTESAINEVIEYANESNIDLWYISPNKIIKELVKRYI